MTGGSPSATAEYPFLAVDEFLKTWVDARSLSTALELGLVDLLLDTDRKAEFLHVALKIDEQGLAILLGLLSANRVVHREGDVIGLSDEFSSALQYRDLLEVRLEFALMLAPDFDARFQLFLQDLPAFMESSKTFDLFRYDRAMQITEGNLQATRKWMRFTTVLTRYEAQACIRHYDFSHHRSMLDIGGNSGEFALQICRQHAQLRAQVLDLPVVCEVGRLHIADQPEAGRITFSSGNALEGPLPPGCDLVSFKSFLHDWQEPDVIRFLEHACEALVPGGSLLIFERGAVEYTCTPAFSMIPNLMFSRFYRDSGFYVDQLESRGMRVLENVRIELEMPFYMVVAIKPAVGG